MLYTVERDDKWARKYTPQFYGNHDETKDACDFYVRATGN
jgi:hypothetical protein